MRIDFFRGVLTQFISLLLLFVCSGFHTNFAQGVTINVPVDQPTIQAAIDVAVPGDLIVVAPGTYWEAIDFKGKGITLRSSDGPQVTIIDGSGSNGSVVQCVNGEGPDTKLEGFTITGGNANEGGGMLNIGTNPTVMDSIFTGNTADDRGGGMYNEEGNPIIISSTFIQNNSGSMGGGMFNLRASPTISGCLFTQNTSNKGAGMRNYINSHAIVTNSVFKENHAGEEGGGMDNRKNSNPIVTGCVFEGNTAASGGGGMHNYVGRAVATGNPTIINCLFFLNSAPSGSAMRNNDPDPMIRTSTFANNQGGAAIRSRRGSSPNLENSIVFGNGGGSLSGDATSSPVVSYSDIEGGFPGTGNLNLDPLFVDPANDDYHLAASSPCIDAGFNDPGLPTTDLDGGPRIVGGTVDMGAYEAGTCPPEEALDSDGDGYSICSGDCNDEDANVSPAVAENCGDGIDNNCDGVIDEGCGSDNLPPVASFGSTGTDLSCNFIDSSTDSDGSIASWSWDFGDGTMSTNQHPSHSYVAAGTYTVTLTVTDNGGATGVPTSQPVTVNEPPEDLTVTGMDPDTVQLPATNWVTTISGTGFAAGAQVSFGGGSGPAPVVESVTVEDSTTITATISFKNGGPQRPRLWNLTVMVGGMSATLQDALTVLP